MNANINTLLESIAAYLSEKYSEQDMARFAQDAAKAGDTALAARWNNRIKRRKAAGDVVQAKQDLKNTWDNVRSSDYRLADAGEDDLHDDEKEDLGIAPAKRAIDKAKSSYRQAYRDSKK